MWLVLLVVARWVQPEGFGAEGARLQREFYGTDPDPDGFSINIILSNHHDP